MAVTSAGGIVVSELQWEGFACVADSGIREALDAAGVDCAVCGHHAQECCPDSVFDQDPHDPLFP